TVRRSRYARVARGCGAGRLTARAQLKAKKDSRLGCRAIVARDHFDRGSHLIALVLAQLRVPDVEDENRTRGARLVPRLVLDRVVEHPRLTGNPLTYVAPDSESAVGRHDQRQVHGESRVRDAG